MERVKVTASARGKQGAPLKDASGKIIERTMLVPESPNEIEEAFGSLRECVERALKHTKVMLQNEIRLEAEGPTGERKRGGWTKNFRN